MKTVEKIDCDFSCGTIRRYLTEKIQKAKENNLSESYIHSIELVLKDLDRLQENINYFI